MERAKTGQQSADGCFLRRPRRAELYFVEQPEIYLISYYVFPINLPIIKSEHRLICVSADPTATTICCACPEETI